jgi:hypothetical protein
MAGRVADGRCDDRADAGDDVEVDADGHQRQHDVGKQDRRVGAVPAHRLERDLGDQIGVAAGVEHADAFAQPAVFR